MDEEDNVYYLGEYTWPEYHIGDTVLYNEWLEPNDPTNRGLVIKYDRNGEYQWATQIDGLIALANLRDIGFYNDEVAIGGKFNTGSVVLGEMVYEHLEGTENTFILMLDAQRGSHRGHFLEEGPASKSTRHVYWDEEGHLHLYLWVAGEEEMFGENFSSALGSLSGFLVKLNLDSVTLADFEVYAGKDFSLFPNPVEASSYVLLSIDNKELYADVSYTIFDLSGKQISAGKSRSVDGLLEIQMPSLQSGLYVLTVEDSGNRKAAMLVVE